MKIRNFMLTGSYIVFLLLACSNSDPISIGPSSLVDNFILNPSFEEDNKETLTPKSWEVSGDVSAAKVAEGGCTGKYELYYHHTSAYTITFDLETLWATISAKH